MVEYFGEVVKSPSDGREYRLLVLENDMKILLSHEPNCEKSAASLCVAAGSMSDPYDLQGLAHLCEHMLFFETLDTSNKSTCDEKTNATRYSKFIAENGGSCNAFTIRDQTNYHFDVASSAFKESLMRFSKFFTEPPAFPASALEKEINIVNSEHENNITNDAWRKMAVESCTSKINHPFQKFTTGNKETLWTIPNEKSIKVDTRLKEFHGKYYSSNIMSLVVISKESLDELEEMIVPLFSKVINKKIELPKWPDSPFGPEECGIQIDIQSLADVRDLYVCFPIPDTRPYYKTFPHGYLTNLLAHKGPGSLFSLLYGRNWVNNNYLTSSIPARGSGYLSIGLQLTIEGLNHTEEIVGYVFQYIRMLRDAGPQKYFWEELQKVLDIQFRFQEKENPIHFVQRISNLMHVYPLEKVVSVGNVLETFDSSIISKFLNCLTPNNCRILTVSKQYQASETEQREKFYGVRYTVSKISSGNLQAWENSTVSKELHLPLKNEFIPSNFTLKSDRRSNAGRNVPRIIENWDLNTVWFFNEDSSLIPRGFLRVELFSHLPMSNPVSFNLMHLLCMSMKDLLMEQFYSASLAGMNYTITGTMYGAEITVDGFDEKIINLMEQIILKFMNFTPAPNRFQAVKDAYENGLANRKSQQPHLQVPYYLGLLLKEKRFTNDELLESSKCIKMEMLERYKMEFFNQLKLEWFFYGNFLETEALQLVRNTQTILESHGTKVLLQCQTDRLHEISLANGTTSIYKVNHTHRSSCCALFLQVGVRNFIENVLLELLDQVIYEPCFNQLRNKENLGYIVKTSVRKSNGTQGLLILVQGNNNVQTTNTETRVLMFLQQFNKLLELMSDNEIENHKAALISRKLDMPKKIWAKANRIWNNEIYTREYDFDRTVDEVNLIRSITQTQLQSFARKYIDPTASDWKCIILNLSPSDVLNMECPDISSTINLNKTLHIEKVSDWKAQMGLYPLFRSNNYNLIQKRSQ